MTESTLVGKYGRLEDFIALAREGKDIHGEVTLRKQLVEQKVHPAETLDMKSEIDMYLLVGDFTFRIGKEIQSVSKVYMFSSLEESQQAASVDRNIANERLKVDYQRLRAANISFEEKFF
jgi:hypothetical protein